MAADRVRRIVAAIFDCAVDDSSRTTSSTTIGLDSMMAMEFRVTHQHHLRIDLPVLEILKRRERRLPGRSELAPPARPTGGRAVPRISPAEPAGSAVDRDVDHLWTSCRTTELRASLALNSRQTVLTNGVPCPPEHVRGLSKSYGDCRRSATWISTSTTARSSRSSGPTAQASRPRSRSSRGTASATPGRSGCWGRIRDGRRGRRAKIGIGLQEATSDLRNRSPRGSETVRMFAELLRRVARARGRARARRPRRQCRVEGADAVRWAATPARRRARHHRHAGPAVPRRAHHGIRSRGQAPVLGPRSGSWPATAPPSC